VAIGDVGNGFADLVVANFGRNSVSLLLGNGDGTFRPAARSSSVPRWACQEVCTVQPLPPQVLDFAKTPAHSCYPPFRLDN
jgi:hypothetical protein